MGPRNPGGWDAPRLRQHLLRWYDENRRDLPWRRTRDPYAIWVSEIMLQQTRVAVVVDKFHAFLERFPTVAALAEAGEQDVLALWSGLGYYRRARMLHKAAKQLVEKHGGLLPPSASELRNLPGIGAYTAAAIASIAYDEAVAVVDGNVERVLCRLAGWDASPGLPKRIAELAAHLLAPRRPGDFNQAMMELGATVCLPRNPKCQLCPIAAECVTRGEHKTAPRPRMHTRDAAYALCVRGAGTRKAAVLLEQRPASTTVMPGLFELPALHQQDVPPAELAMTVRHAIMQINYRVRIRRVAEAEIGPLTRKGGRRHWVAVADLPKVALTGLARKVLARASLMPDPKR
ncbi:MAG TPA: A/G-specific adenine glycosylase [Terracidiphilus sp.]|nr:A/G-specific adenine glycosylase [Terracidiphilus sp.]